MFKSLIALCAGIASALGVSVAQAGDQLASGMPLIVKTGDIIVQRDETDWLAIKILAVDIWPNGTSTAHCLTFEKTPTKPTVSSLKPVSIHIWHAPIEASSFGKGWELLGNQAPSQEEMAGFTKYLKLTDFPRYLQLSGQDAKKIVNAANEHYLRANALGDQGKRPEAIQEYTKAIDIFPIFFEAIDNRGFTHMELGKFRDALHDFEQSLRVNPDGVFAFFSRGECLMKLGQLKAAEEVFIEGATRFSERRDMFMKFLKETRSLQKKD